MTFRVLRPVAVVAAVALTLSAGLAPTAASAQQQVFGQWSTQNNRNQRQVTGTVTYFSQYDLRIASGNGNNGYGNGYGNGNGNNGNGNGRRHRHRRHDNNSQNGQNGQYGNNGNGQYGNNGRDNDDSGQNGNNGQYGNNGRYGNNGQYNGNEQRIHLHQGTVINPRGTTLQNGMQIRVSGHQNSDGSFEADRIDVVNGQNGQGYYHR